MTRMEFEANLMVKSKTIYGIQKRFWSRILRSLEWNWNERSRYEITN